MHITLMMVSTVNGKITRGDEPDVTAWTSSEDKELFMKMKKEYGLLIMGSASYLANKERIKSSKDIVRIVLTRDPKKYAADHVPNQLEFTDLSAKDLIQNLSSRGYEKILLVGGPEINALFLKENLVDDLHLTIEPQLFGLGKNLIADGDAAVSLQLVSVEKLNDRGTLHAIYTVNKI